MKKNMLKILLLMQMSINVRSHTGYCDNRQCVKIDQTGFEPCISCDVSILFSHEMACDSHMLACRDNKDDPTILV